MSTDCRHDGRVWLSECGEEIISHSIDPRGNVESAHSAGGFSAKVNVGCAVCGFCRDYNRYAKRLPQWVKRAIEIIDNP